MSSNRLKNISVQTHRSFLSYRDCRCLRTNGGHESWGKKGLTRPLTFQSHVKTVPIFIIKQHLKYLGLVEQDYINFLDGDC